MSDKSNNRKKKLTWKDYLAFTIALLETQLLPIIILAIVMLVLTIIFGYLIP